MRRKNYFIILIVFVLVMGLLAGCDGTDEPEDESGVSSEAVTGNWGATLVAKKVDAIPEINGDPNKKVWDDTFGIAGNGTTVKAIYTEDEVAFLFQIDNPTMNIVTPDSWYYDGTDFIQWREYLITQGIEPKREFKPLNMAWEMSEFGLDGGCNYMCHDDGSDRGIKGHAVPEGTKGDLWNMLTKHGYGSPERIYDTGFPLGQLGVSQAGPITFDQSSPNDPYKVNSGTLSFTGWADVRTQTSRDNPDYLGTALDTGTGKYCTNCHTPEWMESSPLQGKQGEMSYERNTIGFDGMFCTAPKYIKLNPENFADAMVITEKDIKEGRAVEIADLSKAEIEKAWAKYDEIHCLVPSYILQEPTENMANVLQGAQWSDGVWSVEVKRALTTPYDDDIQFDDLNKHYTFASAASGGLGQVGIKFVFEIPNTVD